MRALTKAALGATAVVALAGGVAAVPSASATPNPGLKVVGLAGGGTRLVTFTSDEPGDTRGLGKVMGLSGDTALVGIDYRVQDGKLYGLGNQGGLYTIAGVQATRTGNPAVPLDGSEAYDIDVNPAADALRIITAKGGNLRVPFAVPNSAATVDTALTRPVVPATTPPTSEPALGLTGAAYTNNDLDATTGTTLFDIDTARDQVTIQAPANSGTTAATGSTGQDFGANTGFDIYTTLNNGKAGQLFAFAVNGGSFYRINLLNGVTGKVGRLEDRTVTDIALPLGQL